MNSKVLTILTAVIAILGVAGFVMIANEEKGTAGMESAVAFMVNTAYYLLIATVIITAVLSLVSLFKNPSALKKTLIGIAVLGVVLAISYFTASDAAVYDAQGLIVKGGEAGSTSKWAETGLTYSLILGAVGGAFFIFDLLKGLAKS